MNKSENNWEELLETLVGDNEKLILKFFVFFSRFEYALKRSGFLKNGNYAHTNWNCFCNKY